MKIKLPDNMQTKIFNDSKEWLSFMKKIHYDCPEPLDQDPVSFPCMMVYDDSWHIDDDNGSCQKFLSFFVYEWEE